MNKISQLDLLQRQSLPLQQKIIFTQKRIQEWYERYNGNVYVAFSGGKDSTVLLDLVRDLYPEVPAVFCNRSKIKELVEFWENIEHDKIININKLP